MTAKSELQYKMTQTCHTTTLNLTHRDQESKTETGCTCTTIVEEGNYH